MASPLSYSNGGDKGLIEKIKALIERADKNLQSSKLLLNNGFEDVAVSRAYYSMYYAAEAVLLTKNEKFSSHKGVISQFGYYFVKNGPLPSEIGRDFNTAFQDRSLGDYGFNSTITIAMADKAVSRAENFIKTLKEYLIQEGYAL